MTTSEPSLAVEIAEAAAKPASTPSTRPVSGGDVGAREARLSIMIGGDADAVDALQPCWQAMGKTIVHQGGPGAGQHTKMVNQILIASDMIGVCEALLYGYKAGLDLDTVLRIGRLGRGRKLVAVEPRPADHRQQLRARLLRRAFHQGHGHRAWRSRSGWASRCPAWPWPTSSTCRVAAQGHGRDGTHALELALASMSGIDWVRRGS